MLVILFTTGSYAYAAEIYLKNKDRLTGKIIKENDTNIVIKTKLLGEVSIRKEAIDQIIKNEETSEDDKNIQFSENNSSKKEVEPIWRREVSAGYNATGGNTITEQFSIILLVNRNRKHIDEWTLKGNAFYSSSDGLMNGQKWYGMGRYAFSFGKTKRWYHFYRLEVDHDKFAHIDHRTTPAIGIGNWLYDQPDLKLMAEMAIGWEHTEYNDNTENTDETLLLARAYYEKEIFKKSEISEDIVMYPKFDNLSNYRLYSETTFMTSLTESLSLRLSFIDEYNSDPSNGIKHNDWRFISSLSFSF